MCIWDREIEHSKDVGRIIEACKSYGYLVTPRVAQYAWDNHSARYCASWLRLDDCSKEEIWESVKDDIKDFHELYRVTLI